MANTATVGAKNLGSSGVLYSDRRDFYIRPNVVKELWTDVTPFTTVIANQATMSGMADPTFKMFEHRNPWVKQKFDIDSAIAKTAWGHDGSSDVAAASNVKSVNINISGAVGIELGANLAGLELEIFDANNVAKFRCVVIEATATTMKVVALDDVANSAFANTDYAMVIGSAFGEGTGAPTAWSNDLTVVFNQCQIFKTPVEITGTLLQASLRGVSKELGRLRDMKSQEHKIQKERAFLFGANPQGINGTFGSLEGLTDKDGNTLRTTMGLIPALNAHGVSDATKYEQNVFASSDIETYSKFVDSMEKIFQYVPTSGMKRAFVGAGALGHWSKMSGASGFAGDSGWGVDIGDMKRDSLGFNYRTLETPHGMLQLIPTPSLRGPYNKHMVIVSDENLFHAQYRAPKFEASIQANDYDGVKDQYVSDEGIGITLMESHAMMVTP